MDNFEVNKALGEGRVDDPGVLPRLDEMRERRFAFKTNFGLEELPKEPGLLLVRGARQYGKSTWLQRQVRDTIKKHGLGSAFLLNGDEIRNNSELVDKIRGLLPLHRADARVRRLFIDEITAIPEWTRALKILADAGELRHELVVTTGSKAADLRHGIERLPGRKGKLARTAYLFTPLSYSEFKRVCGTVIPRERLLPAYLMSGGSPVACAEIAEHGRVPEYVLNMVRDWIYGEFAAQGRSRAMLLGVMECLYRFATAPVGQSKLAREAGLANNTVAAGYMELLADLMCVAPAYGWDASRRRANRRVPCKLHFSNMLVAMAWHPQHTQSIDDYLSLAEERQGEMMEWQVAQELWRRAAIEGKENPENMAYWRSHEHEIDFVVGEDTFLEVKRGVTSPLEFQWFLKSFPGMQLTVVSKSRYQTDCVKGVTLEEFLAAER